MSEGATTDAVVPKFDKLAEQAVSGTAPPRSRNATSSGA